MPLIIETEKYEHKIYSLLFLGFLFSMGLELCGVSGAVDIYAGAVLSFTMVVLFIVMASFFAILFVGLFSAMKNSIVN